MESSASIVFVESQRMSPRKKTVIEILRDNPGFVSGQAISDSLGISRNAVHKHVNSLRARGFRILGISRRGYRLEEEPRRLVMPVVAKLTQGAALGSSFRYHEEIESTNAEARRLANDGAPEGTVVIAENQLKGRGRLGRTWTSPPGKGLLFSVILRPELAMTDAHLLTLTTGNAVAEAIEAQVKIPVHLKWPNDLIVDNKKAGGILLEVEVIAKGAAQSSQMENRHKTMLAQNFDFGFAVDWMRKDLGICLEEARRNGASLPITALVDQYYEQVQRMGGGRWDTSSLIALLDK